MDKLDLPRGTLEVLVLEALARGPRHGYALVRWIEDHSDGAVLVEEGSLYPAVHRLERKGLIDAEWGTTESGRRARFYTLNEAGRRERRDRAARADRAVERATTCGASSRATSTCSPVTSSPRAIRRRRRAPRRGAASGTPNPSSDAASPRSSEEPSP